MLEVIKGILEVILGTTISLHDMLRSLRSLNEFTEVTEITNKVTEITEVGN